MPRDATVRTEELRGEPVRELHVVVVAGPDAGLELVSTERVTIGSADRNDLKLGDRRVSRFHLELERRGDRIQVTDLGSTNETRVGAVRFEGGAVSVPAGTEIQIGRSTLRLSDGRSFTQALPEPSRPSAMRGVSRPMLRVFRELEALGQTDVSVLVVGESGTGKELLARALHDGGSRKDGPFVTLDCGALPSTIAESALFGHERGAFTGAEREHRGAFERANGGTLFLDEIGELSNDNQVRLLGVLERRRFARVGGEKEIETDVRVVSATNRDLRAAVNVGQFRLDLYYRVAVVTLEVPPLRDRPEDIPELIRHFVQHEGFEGGIEHVFPRAEIDELQRQAWPGNVRELRNVVESALALGALRSRQGTSGASLRPTAQPEATPEPVETFRDAKAVVVRDFEERFLRRLMESTNGNVRQASRVAKIHRGYLVDLLVRHGLK